MTPLNPASRLSSPELAVTLADPPLRVRLPAGGWQVSFRAQLDGRTVIEVTGQEGSLAGLVASSHLPILSVDAGWGGAAREPDSGRRWWALAIGHVPAGRGQPSVAFTRRLPGARRTAARPDAVNGPWVTVDGAVGRRRRALHGGPLRRRSGKDRPGEHLAEGLAQRPARGWRCGRAARVPAGSGGWPGSTGSRWR
jgi:hypothetical protein